MTWKTPNIMTLRKEFIHLALQEGANRRELCRRFEISPKTAYKWLQRFEQEGQRGLEDRSRRPLTLPSRTLASVEESVLALRQTHPTWGSRKLQRRLTDMGRIEVPAASTITRILRRHDLIDEAQSQKSRAWERFEHDQPNKLWQIDFKGNFPTLAGMCYPLTMLDDHSRFNLILEACAQPNLATVQQHLVRAFQRYGLPVQINADNGPPWGSPRAHEHGITPLTIWLIRQGIWVSHSRPAHPQTNGKEERFHRTLKADVLQGRHFTDLAQVQSTFDSWRMVYNTERPHQGIAMATPVTRYQPSPLPYSEALAPIQYDENDLILKVGWHGAVKHGKYGFKVPNALKGYAIALRPVRDEDGFYHAYFCHQRFMKIDLREKIDA